MREEFEKYCKNFHIIRDFNDGSLLVEGPHGYTAFLPEEEVKHLIKMKKKIIEENKEKV